jgi:putative ABC transport system permease protein
MRWWRKDPGVAAEAEAHIAERIDDLIERGVAPEEAAMQARREFGNLTRTVEASREVWRWAWLDRIGQDVRYAVRSMRKAPLFTIAVVACLALGTGVNTAIFTLVHSILLAPLPYPDADRLVMVGKSHNECTESPQRYVFWNRREHGLENFSAFQGGSANLGGRDRLQLVKTITASRDYFALFGVKTQLGRTFLPAEDSLGGGRVAVLSDSLWRQSFAADPSIAGKTVRLNGEPFEVIGVLSPGFISYPEADVWTPLQMEPDSNNAASTLTVAGRLPRDVTLAQAVARMKTLAEQFTAAYPTYVSRGTVIQVVPLREELTGEVRTPLRLLLAAVSLILLVACANVTNLLLARSAARQKEIAIRAATGAGRGRLAQQFATESMLFAFMGAGLGVGIGRVLLRLLLRAMPAGLPRAQEAAGSNALEPMVLLYALLVAVMCGMLFGFAPALRLWRTPLESLLRDSAAGSLGGHGRNRTLKTIVGVEVALTVILLTSSLLLVRSFFAMYSRGTGIDATGVLTMQVSLSGSRYTNSAEVSRFGREAVERLSAIPGIESAAVASALPFYGTMDMIFDLPGSQHASGRLFDGDVQWRWVTPAYFETLRIPLLEGRVLRDEEPRNVAVISHALAQTFWKDANPVGQTILIGDGLGPEFATGPTEIAGVVGDVRERLDSAEGSPVIYLPAKRIPAGAMAILNRLESAGILVRTKPGVTASSVATAIQRTVESTGDVAASEVRTMSKASDASVLERRFDALLFGAFAILGVLLSSIGIYGVTAYGVRQRTQEIGIRTALGATRKELFQWILREALLVAGGGVAAGIIASLAFTRLIRSMLFGVQPVDPATFGLAPAFALVIAAVAASMPALRAARTDAIEALRNG